MSIVLFLSFCCFFWLTQVVDRAKELLCSRNDRKNLCPVIYRNRFIFLCQIPCTPAVAPAKPSSIVANKKNGVQKKPQQQKKQRNKKGANASFPPKKKSKRETAKDLEKSGQYNFSAILKESLEKQPPRLDHADYMNPLLKRECIDDKGVGYVAVGNIQKGALLLASKAFEIEFCTSPDAEVALAQETLAKSIVERLKAEPQLEERVFQLFDGKRMSMKDRLSNEGSGDITDGVLRIVYFNALSSHSLVPQAPKGAGLWIEASFFNHSCVPNSWWHMVGDMIFITASTDIAHGDEVTVSYCDSGKPYDERVKTLDVYGFVCSCPLCKEEQAAKKLMKKLLYELGWCMRLREMEPSALDLKKSHETIIQKMMDASPHSSYMFDALSGFAQFCSAPEERLKTQHKAWESLNNPFDKLHTALCGMIASKGSKERESDIWYERANSLFESHYAKCERYFKAVVELIEGRQTKTNELVSM